MILKKAEPPRAMIICERMEDGSRFTHYTSTSLEALRLLRSTSGGHYRPLYLVRIYERKEIGDVREPTGACTERRLPAA